jgi:hypothetical protein
MSNVEVDVAAENCRLARNFVSHFSVPWRRSSNPPIPSRTSLFLFHPPIALLRQKHPSPPKTPSSTPLPSLAHFDRQCLPKPPEKRPPEKPLPRLPNRPRRPRRRRHRKRLLLLVVANAKRGGRRIGIPTFSEVPLSPVSRTVRWFLFSSCFPSPHPAKRKG